MPSPFLQEAKAERRLSVEDLRDAFAVPYETAAHRFTNLATRHLGIPVHFMKVHEGGTLHKAYENDGVKFPVGPARRHRGAARLPAVDRPRRVHAARPVHAVLPVHRHVVGHVLVHVPRAAVVAGRVLRVASACRSRTSAGSAGARPPSARRRGAPTRCAAGSRPTELAERWSDKSWPSARPHASLLAALPVGVFPGVDTTEVYRFLDRHAPTA